MVSSFVPREEIESLREHVKWERCREFVREYIAECDELAIEEATE